MKAQIVTEININNFLINTHETSLMTGHDGMEREVFDPYRYSTDRKKAFMSSYFNINTKRKPDENK